MIKTSLRLEGKRLIFENGVHLGDVEQDVDGFFYFWPELRGGYWDQTVLRAIADLLEEKNKPWQEQIERELGGNKDT